MQLLEGIERDENWERDYEHCESSLTPVVEGVGAQLLILLVAILVAVALGGLLLLVVSQLLPVEATSGYAR